MSPEIVNSGIVKEAYLAAAVSSPGAYLPPALNTVDLTTEPNLAFWVVLYSPRHDFTLSGVLFSPEGLEVDAFSHKYEAKNFTWHSYNKRLPVHLLRQVPGEWTITLSIDGTRVAVYSLLVDGSKATVRQPSFEWTRPSIEAAWSAYRRANYVRAVDLARRVLGSSPAPSVTANALTVQGLSHWQLGDFAAALQSLEAALELRRAQQDGNGIGDAFLNLALVNHTMGDLQQAARLLDTALPYLKNNAHRSYALSLWRAGKIRLDLNRLDEAQTFFESALQEAERPWRDDLRSLASAGLGEVERRRGRFYGTLAALAGAGQGYAEPQTVVGWWHFERGDYDAAASAFERVYRIKSLRHGAGWDFSSLAALVRVEMARGNNSEARNYLSQLERHIAGVGLTSDTWRIWLVRGLLDERQGTLEGALKALQEAARQVELLRGRIHVDELRATYAEDKQELYESLIRVSLRLGRHRDAFNAIERAKSRAFLDLLTQRHLRAPSLAADETASKYEELDRAQRVLEAEVLAAQAGDSDRPERQEVTRKSHELKRVAEERQKIARELGRNGARLLEISAQPAVVDELLQRIPPSAVLLNYYIGRRISVVGILRATAIEVVEIERPTNDEILTLSRLLADPHSTNWEPRARELYAKLIGPLADRLASSNTVIISPHGALHYLPFQALISPDGEFIATRWAIAYLPSASVLRYLSRPSPAARQTVLAVANPAVPDLPPLPGSEAEVRGIAELFPTSVLAREHALKLSVTRQSPMHRVLHFATHGELDVQRPMQSSLRLTPSANDDGRLTVDEIFALDLHADLAVLSACNTGLGATVTGEVVSPGDELVGLSQAFLYAGTQSLVVTLWPVADDATAQLMVDFYRNLREARPKASALQKAQLALVARGRAAGVRRDVKVGPESSVRTGDARLAHPFYWAGFVLVGDGQ